MTKFGIMTAIACVAMTAMSASAAENILFEEAYARDQEKQIITAPIAGLYNRFWFDYRIDITEAQKELASDLRKADDIEDRRDAWEEYGDELRKERKHYIDEMAERGYRMGTVTVANKN